MHLSGRRIAINLRPSVRCASVTKPPEKNQSRIAREKKPCPPGHNTEARPRPRSSLASSANPIFYVLTPANKLTALREMQISIGS